MSMPIPVRHGGRLAEACRRYGGKPDDWLDLSTGINPLPWTGSASIDLDWTALPDPDALRELESTAARHFGVAPDHCCAIGGSELAIRMLARVLEVPGHALRPAYGTHSEAFPGPAAFGEVPPSPCAVIFANPNNPDGKLFEHEAVIEWAARLGAKGSWLVVDEAFADCHPAQSVAPHVGEHRRLIVLRSFGKFFGLAGLRLGFMLGPRRILGPLRELTGDWSVHSGALAIGTAAYRDTGWIERTRGALFDRAGALDVLLFGHALQPTGTCPLFRLVETERAAELFHRLANARILVRPFEQYSRWLRFGVPAGSNGLKRLETALDHG